MSDTIPHDDTPRKQCIDCGKFFPPTTEFFPSDRKRLKPRCRPCDSAHHRKWREAHRQERIDYCKAWHAENHEKDVAYRKNYNDTHQEELIAYRIRTRDHKRERMRAHYRSHKEEYKRYREALKHSGEYKEYYRVKHRERYARKKNAVGIHTVQDIQQQYERQKGKCYYCSANFDKGKNAYHVDHVIPITRGGSNDASNLVLACPTCNLRKGNKLPHEWPEGGRLL